MKIIVGIASRGRPLALTGVVMGLDRLKSGKHEVQYVVGADHDDAHTGGAILQLKEEVNIVGAWDKRTTLAFVWNRLAAFDKDADLVTLMSDRTFCITPSWDDILADAVEQKPNRVLWWSSPGDSDHTVPIISKAWLQASDYRWCHDIWPFWFADTENREIDLLVSARPPLKVSANFAGARAQTQSGRDFAFWFKLYAALRPSRVERARKIAKAFGQDIRMPPDGFFDAWDQEMQARSEEFEQIFGDKRGPSAAYIKAYNNGVKLLKELTDG